MAGKLQLREAYQKLERDRAAKEDVFAQEEKLRSANVTKQLQQAEEEHFYRV